MKAKKFYFLIPLILLLLNTSIYAEEPEKSVNQNEWQEIKNGLKELENKFHKLDKELTRQETENEGNQERLEGLINKLPDVSDIYIALSIIIAILGGLSVLSGFGIRRARDEARKTVKEIRHDLKESKRVLREIKRMREKSLEESSTIHSLAEKADELNSKSVDRDKLTEEVKESLSVYLLESDELAGIKKDISFLEETQKEAVSKIESRINDLSKIGRLAEEIKQVLPASHYYNLGYDSYELGKYKEAIEHFTKAIDLKPDAEDFLLMRGLSYKRFKNFKEALSDYNKAIELKPDYSFAYNNRGIVYADLNRKDEALSDYNKAIELKPDYTSAYLNLGELLICTLKFGEATKFFIENKNIFLSVRDKTISLYLIQMALAGDGRDMKEFTHEYKSLLKDNPGFKLKDWSFRDIYNFLKKQEKEVKIPADRLNKMRKIHEEFKRLA